MHDAKHKMNALRLKKQRKEFAVNNFKSLKKWKIRLMKFDVLQICLCKKKFRSPDSGLFVYVS